MTRPPLLIMVLLAGTVLGLSVVSQLRGPLLPAMGAELRMSATQLGWIGTVFGLGRLVLDMPAGALADRTAAALLLVAGALSSAAGALITAWGPGYTALLVGAVLLGFGSSMATTVGMVAFTRLATPANRGRMMSIFQASNLSGQAFGPAVAGWLAAWWGWRGAYAGGAVVALLGALAAAGLHGLPNAGAVPAAGPRKPESNGQASTAPHHGGPPARWVQLLPLYAAAATIFAVMGGLLQTVLPLDAAGRLRLSVGAISIALGIGGTLRFASAIATGFLSDRLGRKAVLVPGLLGMAAGALALPGVRSLAGLVVAVVAITATSTGITVAATMLADLMPNRSAGLAIGLFRFTGSAGLLVGPVTFGWLYEHLGLAAVCWLTAGLLAVAACGVAGLAPETRWQVSPPSQANGS